MAEWTVHPYGSVPPAVERDRVEAFQRLHDGHRSVGFATDAMMVLSIALVEGHQWIMEQRRTPSTSSGRSVLQVLPERSDPSVDNIRVTLNRIKDLTEEVAALLRIDPAGWKGSFEPDEADPVGSHAQMRIVRRIWRDYLQTIDLHTESVLATEWRAECGTGILKAVPDLENPYGWTIVCLPLDRLVWDSAVKTPNFALHRQWADSAAWAAEDVTRTFGMKFPNTKNLPTMTQLKGFDTAIGEVRNVRDARGSDSKTPAVLVTEFYDDYSRRLTVMVHTGTGAKQSYVAWDGPNPYGRCPLLQLNMGTSLVTPLGVGVPMRLRPDQTILNLAMTSIVRHMLVSAGRWVIEAGSLKNPNQQLSPRIGSPIIWTPQRPDRPIEPHLVQPMQPNVIAHQLVDAIPQIMGEKVHIQPVMQGITSPRGESRAAIVEKLGQAGRVYHAAAETDDDRIRRFLSYHAKFIANQPDKRERVFVAVGSGLQKAVLTRYQLVDTGQAKALIDANVTVSLPPGALQPKTPAEKEDRILRLASLNAFSAEQLQWELYQQTGVPVTSEQESDISNAAEENLMFMAGAAASPADGDTSDMVVDAKNFESHDIHVFVHKILIRERHTMNGVTDDIVREVQWHIADHYDEKSEESFQKAADQMAAEGMPGAMGEANTDLLSDSPLSGSMGAPTPSREQYAKRDMQTQSA